ncbi:hypothetical protein Asppvi_009981 [Aspergillus pseudoviridinutans]|uniref:Xylanolytic transcriptional activator regulatory domain-containing protein n=1 Tax=Aspergillus pseudoviridinutans TaxID=1517512 RepID=A0A9P3EWN4_9EURO|nr:uncharacterized protein Asppvi_009981 [Aspergillus pseudoviridinutans]GIJ91016.1 hypothetical protein Asppvi_009981 [Aspergillus pseudoviridinutans]
MACLVGVSSQMTSDAASKTEQENRRQAQKTSQLVLPWDESFTFTHESASVILTEYRTEMAFYCPSVVIPLDMTVPELQQKSPLLLGAVQMVTCIDDAIRKKRMTDQFLEHVSRSIVKKRQSSLDILQAILVCISWYHLLPEPEAQLSIILHLGLAMLRRLGLHRRPNPSGGKLPQSCERDNAPTTDERRAYLGCFYTTCVAAICVKDMDPLRYTSYTEECCRVLEELQEYPTDMCLVQLSRLNRMAHKIVQILPFDSYNQPHICSSDSIQTCVKALGAELRHLKPSSAHDRIQDSILALQYHSLELLLYESALEDHSSKSDRSSTGVHYDILHSSLASAKAFFSTFSSLAPQYFLYLPYSVYQQYYHAVDSLSKFLLLAWKERDQIDTRITMDVATAVNMFIAKAKEAVQLLNHEESSLCAEEILHQLIARVRAFEELHEARLAGVESYDIDRGAASRNSIRDATFALPHDMSWQFLDSE